MKLNGTIENVIAFAEIASEQLISSVSNASKAAGKAINFEIEIKKLNSLKENKIKKLGEYAVKYNEVNKDILGEIDDINKKINDLKKERQEHIEKESQ